MVRGAGWKNVLTTLATAITKIKSQKAYRLGVLLIFNGCSIKNRNGNTYPNHKQNDQLCSNASIYLSDGLIFLTNISNSAGVTF